MSANEAREFVVENARLLWPNFAGTEKAFNKEGDRNFNLRIDDPEFAASLIEDGWRLKPLNLGEGHEDEQAWKLPVAIKYPKNFERLWPEVIIISSKGKRSLGEDEIKMLDWVEKSNVDVIIRPRKWVDDSTGETRVKAFLKKIVVTIVEDPLEQKYADLPYSD